MGKKKAPSQPESALLLPRHPNWHPTQLIDTHCHLLSTFNAYTSKYLEDRTHESLTDFVRALLIHRGVTGMVDVWCEVPRTHFDEVVNDMAAMEGFNYRFVVGVHPHEASSWNDEVEADLLNALAHPRNCGLGECGLDYHYDNSPREKQQEVLRQQLKIALRLGKSLTIHTREADEDIERILKEEMPKDWPIHVHCFTDTLELATKLLDHFSNLVIGITGVTTFATNENTPAVIRHLAARAAQGSSADSKLHPLRLVFETDSPYMAPTNLPYAELGLKPKGRLPLSHSAMIPWTADFTAKEASKEGGKEWTLDQVLEASNANAKAIYGIC